MCWTCFKRYADTPVMNDAVVAAYRLMKVTNGQAASASSFLHVIVGDMNVDDDVFNLTHSAVDGDYVFVEPWELSIFSALKALSEPERATAVAMEWGYISEDGTVREDCR